MNSDGTTTAGSGGNSLLNDNRINSNHAENLYNYDPVYTVADGEQSFDNAGWQDGYDNRAAGGSGGNSGSASTSSSANTVTVGWPT